ncbi:hypothetical protein [uncultured Eubacterium sp.]|jgi:hypothetical protein|uniref:DUF6980 family protein n=1 Tax=uncultured Eubacterium sp. TaxID=165185 RepID=UPI0026193AA8|nr:hypothetical protein [uncultured Eubacterium sp.]
MMCCEMMEYFLNNNESNKIIQYSDRFDEYGIVIHDGGNSSIIINYCPWCGKELPKSKRDEWFDTLEKLGFINPLEEDIPIEFKSNLWWNKNDIRDN